MRYKQAFVMIIALIALSMQAYSLDFVDNDMIVSNEIIIKDMIVREDYIYRPFEVCNSTTVNGRKQIDKYSYDECNTQYDVDTQSNFTIEKHAVIDMFANDDIKYHCVGFAYDKSLHDDLLSSELNIRDLPQSGELLVSGQPQLDYTLTTLEGDSEYIEVACFQSDYNTHTFYFNLTNTFNITEDTLGYNSYNQPNAIEDVNVFLAHIDYQNYHKYLTEKYYEESSSNYESIREFFITSISLILVAAVLAGIQLGLQKMEDVGDTI